jgi:hypothetical protein
LLQAQATKDRYQEFVHLLVEGSGQVRVSNKVGGKYEQ